MRTITHEQETAIRDWLATHPTLAVGIGTAEQACSVAAINLALSGELTDRVPDCMSRVIGRWIIGIQDRMPDDIRNSADWRDLLPLAAGTGRAHETERLAIVMDWMWGTVLPLMQSVADTGAFGAEWRAMCEQRTAEAAYVAYVLKEVLCMIRFCCRNVSYTPASAASADSAEYADYGPIPWTTLDPVGLLRRLIAVTDARAVAE